MASIKIADLKKIDAACKNGFHLDLHNMLVWNEKMLVKDIDIDDCFTIKAVLDFDDVYTGKGWQREKIGVKPILRIKKLTREDHKCACYRSVTVKEVEQGEMIKRKSIKKLQELSAKFDNYTILQMVMPQDEAREVIEFM